jgi:hypothetical protein
VDWHVKEKCGGNGFKCESVIPIFLSHGIQSWVQT